MRLHDIEPLPEPRHVAYALADVGYSRLEAARIYHEEWCALEHAGVPAKFRRELLEDDLPISESVEIVREWAGPTGQPDSDELVLVGNWGTAKSYALAGWALCRHRNGLSTHWESVAAWCGLDGDGLRARARSLYDHGALILDDIGAGSLTSWHREMVESVLVERHARERPTAIAMNGTLSQAMETLGGRSCSRIVNEGGKIVALKMTESMRRPKRLDVDKIGRTPLYLRHLWLLDVMGHRIADVPIFEGDQHARTEARHAYGHELAAVLCRGAWLDLAETVRDRLGVPAVHVEGRAREIANTEPRDSLKSVAASCLSRLRQRHEEAHQAAERERIERQRKQHERRNKIARQIAERVDPKIERGHKAPQLEREQLVQLGVSVAYREGGFAVYHAPLAFDANDRLVRRKKKSMRSAPICKAVDFPTSDAAWSWASGLFADPGNESDVAKVDRS